MLNRAKDSRKMLYRTKGMKENEKKKNRIKPNTSWQCFYR